MERNTVLKFGGTSVKTAAAITQTATVIENNPATRIVVVSAVGGVTTLLVEFCQTTGSAQLEIIQQLKDIHIKVAEELQIWEAVGAAIMKMLALLDILAGKNSTLAQSDRILALGEQLSSHLVYHALRQRGNSVVLINATDCIITDNHFGKATPNLALIKQKAAAMDRAIAKDTIILTQGFIGATATGETTTLGRGGSDLSAALLAEAFNAAALYIYTDVQGVYTMDPNTIPQARLIERISFQEMAELANFGAKILHPATLAPCLRAKIPVTIASTFAPDGGNTYISPENIEDNAPSQFRAISMRKKQILVTVRSLNMLDVHGFLARLFTLLAHYRVSVDLMTTSEISVAMTIDSTSWGSHGNNPFHNEKMMQELGEIAEVTIEEGLTLVAVVGSGLTDAKTVQMILSKVVEHPIRVVCYGASSSSIGLLVQEPAALSVVQALHQGLITMPDYALA